MSNGYSSGHQGTWLTTGRERANGRPPPRKREPNVDAAGASTAGQSRTHRLCGPGRRGLGGHLAAVIVGAHLGRGAAVQITLAASMATAALGQSLLSPLWQTVVGDPGRRGFVGGYNRLGAVAFIAVLLCSAVGGACSVPAGA